MAAKRKRGAGGPASGTDARGPGSTGSVPAGGAQPTAPSSPSNAPDEGAAAVGQSEAGGASNPGSRSGGEAGPAAAAAAPRRRQRLFGNLVIVGFLGWQLLFPLRYYLGDDPFDERFAWRMFSPVRLVSCDVRLLDADHRPINLSQGVHVVWVNLLKRARLQVLDAVADRLCADAVAEGRPAHMYAEITCPPPDGPTRGICRQGPRDADRDGIPDGFKDATECDGRSPQECFRAACGDRDAATCHRETCVVPVVDPSDDLCDGRDH